MKRIGLISDTHGTFDDVLQRFLANVDEIWHAGDFGNIETADAIAAFKPLRGVYGNIDGAVLRRVYPRWQQFECEQVKVVMTHIGGYPGRYYTGVADLLRTVLKVIYDKKLDLLHLNPGAAGLSGFHRVRTALRFVIDGERIEELEVGEWERRSIL